MSNRGTESGSPAAVTRCLEAWRRGEEAAPEALLAVVYDELRGLARGYLRRERPDHTLESAALVHEVYLRLLPQRRVRWVDRHHFFGIAAQAMRRLLLDAARRRAVAKRGGGRVRQPIVEELAAAPARPTELAAVDRALTELGRVDAEGARLVELRYFAGLSLPAIAALTGVSLSTAERRWRAARAWLHHRLRGETA